VYPSRAPTRTWDRLLGRAPSQVGSLRNGLVSRRRSGLRGRSNCCRLWPKMRQSPTLDRPRGNRTTASERMFLRLKSNSAIAVFLADRLGRGTNGIKGHAIIKWYGGTCSHRRQDRFFAVLQCRDNPNQSRVARASSAASRTPPFRIKVFGKLRMDQAI